MEELKSCFFFWLQILVWGEKVENEGRYVPTSNSAREERGEGEGLENRALEYMILYFERDFFRNLLNQIWSMSWRFTWLMIHGGLEE